ncbi:MAG: O-acetyl-ADP-ribose deacetylase [Clostridiales bacterium]|nr:O-acetyl-ADP-ribose deacetylase [Clostridiales bacterium]
MGRVHIIQGDITELQVDAIVNVASPSLLGGGGGVDNAIHRAAGQQLLEECETLNGCHPGEAKITKGYLLPAEYVIHTVGPIYQGGDKGEPEILYSCYRNSLSLAAERQMKTIAFPCISTGVYGYPFYGACKIALNAIFDFLRSAENLKVFLVCYSDAEYKEYQTILYDKIHD